MALDGKKYTEISQITGMDKRYVAQISLSAGVRRNKIYKRLDDKSKEKLIQMFISGVPRKKIAEIFGIRFDSLSRIARKRT